MKKAYGLVIVAGLLVGCGGDTVHETVTVSGIVKHVSIYRDTNNNEGVCVTFENGQFFRLRAKMNQELPFVIKRHQMITYNKDDLMIVDIK